MSPIRQSPDSLVIGCSCRLWLAGSDRHANVASSGIIPSQSLVNSYEFFGPFQGPANEYEVSASRREASCKQGVTGGGKAAGRERISLDNAPTICDTTASDAHDRFTRSGQMLQTHRQGVDWSVTSDRPPGPFSPQ